MYLPTIANDRRLRTQRIEISNVSFWAFSQEADNSVCLWASGKAGWFELHDPVPQYRDFFEGMNEAVSMLYYLADKWRRSRKSHLCVKDKELEKYVRCVFRDVSVPCPPTVLGLLLMEHDSTQDLGVVSRVGADLRRAYKSSTAMRNF